MKYFNLLKQKSGMGLTILVIIIAVGAIIVGASARGFENMARQTQLRIDQTKAHYLAQAGVMRAVWKWYTNNDVATTNEVARRWSPINTTVIGNNLFKAGSDSAGAYLQSNFAYIVPGMAFVKNVGTLASKAAASNNIVVTLGAGITVPVGDFLVVSLAQDGGATAAWACTDNTAGGPNVYTLRSNIVGPGANTNVSVRTVILSAPVTFAFVAGNTITCSWTTNVTAKAMTVAQYSGVDSFHIQNTGTGTSTAPASAAAVTTIANQLLVGAIGIEGPSTETFTAGTDYISAPPTRIGTTGGAAADITIDPEYRIVYAAGNYTATGTNSVSRDWTAAVASFYAVNRWITSGANRRLAYWQIYNTHNASAITLTQIKVSWTGGGLARVNDFVLNGVSKWPGGTSASGATINITDTALASGAAWQGPNTYIQWDNSGPADPTTITCQFFFSGDTATSDAKSHEVMMWDGLRANGAGMPGHRAFTVVATGQVNQTSPAFKVLKTIKAKVSGAPATAAAPAVPVMEITDWDEGDKNIP